MSFEEIFRQVNHNGYYGALSIEWEDSGVDRGEVFALAYGVETRVLVQAVKRNRNRFPADFMLQLSKSELENWRSQIVMSNPAAKMGLRRRPYAFTEHGVAMLASVLRSERAVQVNIAIVRTFLRLRQMLQTHKDLARKLAEMERQYDAQFKVVFDAIRELMAPPAQPPKRRIGFHARDDG